MLEASVDKKRKEVRTVAKRAYVPPTIADLTAVTQCSNGKSFG